MMPVRPRIDRPPSAIPAAPGRAAGIIGVTAPVDGALSR
jgi:hypothetical protein